jgi:hypothetical protein
MSVLLSVLLAACSNMTVTGPGSNGGGSSSMSGGGGGAGGSGGSGGGATLPPDSGVTAPDGGGAGPACGATGDPALAALHAAEQALPSTPHDPSRSLDVVNADRGVCAIRGGAGLFLAPLAFRSMGDCQALCSAFASTNPNRTCTWRDTVFAGDPVQACVVRDGAFQTLSSLAAATFSQCRSACDTSADADRTCDWGTERIQHPARGTECRILSGAGANVLSPLRFTTQAACQALCDQSGDPYRRCTYGNAPLKEPDLGARCELWGGAGVVLTPVFFSSQSDCQSACTGFAASHPNRFCFYGTTRLP